MAGLLVAEALLRRAERLALRVRPNSRGLSAGEHRGRGHSSSLELSDHRAYAPGDDFRRVDWNAFARLDTLNVKLAEPQQSVVLHLLVDRSASMEFGTPTKARMAQQIAACLTYVALSQVDAVRVHGLIGARLSSSPRYVGKAQAAEALRRVHGLVAGRDTDLDAALAAFVSCHPEPGLAVLLSDWLSPSDPLPRLRQLVALGLDAALVHILSDAELRPQFAGDLELVDSETGRRRRVGLTSATLQAYAQSLERWQARVRDECRALAVRYVPVQSVRSIEAVVLADLRRYGLLE